MTMIAWWPSLFCVSLPLEHLSRYQCLGRGVNNGAHKEVYTNDNNLLKMPKWPVLLLPEPTRKTEIESEGEKERE